jgi:hypothetical protein
MSALTKEVLESLTDLPLDMQQEALSFVRLLKRQITQVDTPTHNGQGVAEIMARMAKRGTAFKQVDPVAWQQEVRRDRPLPGRDA